MNQDRIAGQWKQLSGKIKAQWGKLTDDDLKQAEGNSEYLAGKIQERYGIAKDVAEKQVKEFQHNLH
ncbi:MAG: CsbD family protein [Rudaea sp.]|nr:CsbD family protein [Rudaea sp.]